MHSYCTASANRGSSGSVIAGPIQTCPCFIHVIPHISMVSGYFDLLMARRLLRRGRRAALRWRAQGYLLPPVGGLGPWHLHQLLERDAQRLMQAFEIAPPEVGHAVPQVPGLLAADPRPARQLADGVHPIA